MRVFRDVEKTHGVLFLLKLNTTNMLCCIISLVDYLKATRHLICSSCSNWVDFIKSGCEKSFRFRRIVLVLSVGDVRG